MKSDLLELIGKAQKSRTERFRYHLPVFLVCLVLSVFIWSLVRLSKDYYYTLEYHLIFTQPPSNLHLRSVSDSVVNLRLRIQGYDFFSEEFIFKKYREHEVSLRYAKIRSGGEGVTGFLLTNRIGKEIVTQTSFPSDVYYMTPDTIFLEFDKVSRKNPSRTEPQRIKPVVDSSLRKSDSAAARKGRPSFPGKRS